jgi:hypothetical protein
MDTQDTQQTETEAQPGGAVVDLPEPDEQEGGEGSEQPAEPERQSRKDRRGAWLQETRRKAAEAEDLRKKWEESERQRQEQAQQIAELRGRFEQSQQQRQQSQEDPYEARLTDLRSRSAAHLAASAAAQDKEVAKRELQAYHEAQEAIADLRAERTFARRQAEFAANMPDPEVAGVKVTLGAEFPWLQNNAAARQAADGYINILLSKGRPDNIATYREACALAAKDFSLGGQEKPTEQQRARYNGVPAKEGAGSSDGGQRVSVDGATVKLAKAYLNSKGQAFTDDADAVRKWSTAVNLNKKA